MRRALRPCSVGNAWLGLLWVVVVRGWCRDWEWLEDVPLIGELGDLVLSAVGRVVVSNGKGMSDVALIDFSGSHPKNPPPPKKKEEEKKCNACSVQLLQPSRLSLHGTIEQSQTKTAFVPVSQIASRGRGVGTDTDFKQPTRLPKTEVSKQ